MIIKAFKTVPGKEPMSEAKDFTFINDTEWERALICVFDDIEYQEIKGFGGAFTEAAAVSIDKLTPDKREEVLRLYFDEKEGIGYNYGRVHINSCDFSLENYTYVEDGDKTLKTFDISRAEEHVIPMIRDAMKYGDIDMLASPWSPPAYMKTNGEMNHGGKLKEEYFGLWAEYFVKFIEKFREKGINIGSVSVQNEPKATQFWDSCVYTAEEERDFVKNYLGKKMQNMGVKILFWDHNKDRVINRSKVMLGDKEAANYIYGIGVHWYTGTHFEQLEMFNRLYPDKDIVFTEGCCEYAINSWNGYETGERYAYDMIGNFNNYCNIFCDWNLVLDEKGGPNHVGNFCDAPIMIDTQNNSYEIHDSYYYIGHFSKFVKKGAKRIGSSRCGFNVETVSFKNPDGSIVCVVLNRTDNDRNYCIWLRDTMIEIKSEAHSIATYIFEG